MKLPEAIVEALEVFHFFPLKLARAGASANPLLFKASPVSDLNMEKRLKTISHFAEGF